MFARPRFRWQNGPIRPVNSSKFPHYGFLMKILIVASRLTRVLWERGDFGNKTLRRAHRMVTEFTQSRNQIYAIALSLLMLVPAIGQEYTLSDFNGTGFDYTWNDFEQTIGSDSVRITGPEAWGGAGRNLALDFTPYESSRFVVDFRRNAANGADKIDLELIDVNGNTGKWPINVASAPVSQWVTGVAVGNLANPTSNFGDPDAFDLSNIVSWQVLGDFGNPNPIDISFDRVAVSSSVAPPEAYPGRSLDASWRTQAATNIDQYRKADLQVQVRDVNGRAIPGANVAIDMQQHEFGFGSAVVASRLRDDNAVHATYKEKVAENFNKATLENNLKWPAWEGEYGQNFTQWGAVAALDWLADQGIEARGHAAVWPGYDNLPQPVQSLLDQAPLNTTQQQQLRNLVNSHIDEIASAVAGKVVEWDVINEPRTNHDIMDALPEGDQIMATWFQRLAANDSEATRYINEYDILASGGGVDTSKQNTYLNHIQGLIDDGAGVEGIGFQSHFTEGTLTGPEQVWAILDQYADLGLKMQVTEFDFATTDAQLQADFTRDFMTAIFAHEDMEDFIQWGFWEGAHWRPDAAMYDQDWNLKQNGQQYKDLVFDEWWTDVDKVTDLLGEATERGFKGDYQITVEYNGQTYIQTITLGDGGAITSVTLDLALGDFTGEGEYACADIDQLVAAIASGSNLETFDLTGDGIVDNDDLDAWLATAGALDNLSGNSFLPGDANLDGFVDASDFNAWNSNKFSHSAGWCGGDFNADGVTDASDFNLWNSNKFTSSNDLVAVPEPGGMLLLLLGCGGLLRRRNRK